MHFNESSNFIYDSGFKVESDYRKSVNFIIKDGVMFGPEQKLNIESNSKIEIHIFDYATSLEKFFSKDIDDKVEYIKSIDL